MNFKDDIKNYQPINEQEIQDQKVIIQLIEQSPHILTRDNYVAHITSSGFIMNPTLTKVLMIHHNIMKKWAWTGGHADGESDLLAVALKEAREETGVKVIQPLSSQIASLDILPVSSHFKNGCYVNTHLHLSVAYLLICDENQPLKICEKENSGVEWIDIDMINHQYFSEHDVYLYHKLIDRAQKEVEKIRWK